MALAQTLLNIRKPLVVLFKRRSLMEGIGIGVWIKGDLKIERVL